MCSLPRGTRIAVGWMGLVFALGLLVDSATAQVLRNLQPLPERLPGAPRRIVVRLTAEAFAPIVDRDVDETRPVRDVILGTAVAGQTRTTGKPTVALTDDNQCASFVLTLKGVTVSRTVGHNGPAVIRSRSETYFTATKRVVFEAGKGFVAEPAKIDARTRIITEGIGSTRPGLRGRIVQRRAAPRVAASRPAAEEIVRQKAMRRVSATFDNLLEGKLARLNRAMDVREALAFVLRGETEPRYSFCTVDGCVQIVASSGPEDDPPAAVHLPKLDRQGAPLQIWVHESLVGDNLARFLKQIDQLRQDPGTPLRTLAAIQAGFRSQGASANASPESDGGFDYTTAEDWLVMHVQLPTEPQQAGNVASKPSARPTRRQ